MFTVSTKAHSQSLSHFLIVNSLMFCYRLPDINKALLQLIDATKLIPVHLQPETA